jgi:hypothetical protein
MANAIIRQLAPNLELIRDTNTTGETIENKTNGLVTLVSAENKAGVGYDYMTTKAVLATLNPGETFTLTEDGAVYIEVGRESQLSTVPTFRITAT